MLVLQKRNPPGSMYNWKTRENVFKSIEYFIGTHGKAVAYTSERFGVSTTTIYDWIAKGSIVHISKQTRNGTNNVIMDTHHIDFLTSYLSTVDCQLYVCEQITLLWDTFGALYTEHQIRNALTSSGYSRKVIEKVAAEQNNATRASWIQMIQIG